MKTIVMLLAALTLGSGAARAQPCSALPYTLSNGNVGDAFQVMGNFNALLGCTNATGRVNAGTGGEVAYYAVNGATVSSKSLSDLLDLSFSSTQGSILFRGASGWQALGPGTSTYVLTANGVSANPSWASGGGSGVGINTVIAAGISSSAATVALPSVPVASRPALSAFSWLNQASSTGTDNTNGPLVLRTTQNSGSTNGINALIKGVAGTDWTVTVQYAQGNHVAGSNVDLAGLTVYNSTTGKLYICGLSASGSVGVWAYSSTTAYSSTSGTKTVLVTPYSIWVRAKYVSSITTLTFSYSTDGFTWETIFNTISPFVAVPTHYGVAVGSAGNASGHVLSLNYFLESSP